MSRANIDGPVLTLPEVFDQPYAARKNGNQPNARVPDWVLAGLSLLNPGFAPWTWFVADGRALFFTLRRHSLSTFLRWAGIRITTLPR